MLQIKSLTTKKCWQCEVRQETAEVKFKDGTFTGVLCQKHLWDAMKRASAETAVESHSLQSEPK